MKFTVRNDRCVLNFNPLRRHVGRGGSLNINYAGARRCAKYASPRARKFNCAPPPRRFQLVFAVLIDDYVNSCAIQKQRACTQLHHALSRSRRVFDARLTHKEEIKFHGSDSGERADRRVLILPSYRIDFHLALGIQFPRARDAFECVLAQLGFPLSRTRISPRESTPWPRNLRHTSQSTSSSSVQGAVILI